MIIFTYSCSNTLKQKKFPLHDMMRTASGVNFTSITHSLHLCLQVNDAKPHPTFRVLPEDSAWTRKIVTHSILYNLVDFMTDTIRAIKYMKIKKLTRSLKEEIQLLKHEQWIAWPFVRFYLSGHIFIYLSIYCSIKSQVTGVHTGQKYIYFVFL